MSGKVNARNVLDVVKRVEGSSEVLIRAKGKDFPCKACWADATACLPGRRRIILEPLLPDDKPKEEPTPEPVAEVVEPPAPPSEPSSPEPEPEAPVEEAPIAGALEPPAEEPDPEPEPLRRRPGRPRKE